jgi:hypothetical protein
MWKNSVNWRRTWFGSTMEIICPVLLMFILVYARTAISIEAAEKFDVYQLKVPLYPTAHLLENNTWTTQNFQTTK